VSHYGPLELVCFLLVQAATLFYAVLIISCT
jgi:hypothetical protein